MRQCRYCGCYLDAGEVCDCKQGTVKFERATKRPMTAAELKAKLENMTYAEYDRYCKTGILA